MSSTAATENETVFQDDDDLDAPPSPSITNSILVYWVLPVLLISILSRFAVDTGPAAPLAQDRPISFKPNQQKPTSKPVSEPPSFYSDIEESTPTPPPSTMPSTLSNKPSSYQELVTKIHGRRLDWSTTITDDNKVDSRKTESPSKPSKVKNVPEAEFSTRSQRREQDTNEPPRGPSKDPVRLQLLETIDDLRKQYQSKPDDLFRVIKLADALRMYDVQYHDGGSFQEEAVGTYKKAIEMASAKREAFLEQGEETNRSLSGVLDINDEMTMDYTARSIDGVLCALHTALGKAYFMANMFEQAVESYNRALEIEPFYLDAVSSRGSSRIILGKYEEAAKDFSTVIERDDKRRFQDVFTGLARVLQTKESVVPGGWDPMIEILMDLIPSLETNFDAIDIPEGKTMLANTLNRFYHVLFVYHDAKTKDADAAWDSLTKSYRYKMSALPPWNAGFESQKIGATKQIFNRGFWPDGVGSNSPVPIFVIGFVRSGSTLLERVLDAHPQIVGTGENSVFNGQLDAIRNKIVEVSMLGDPNALATTIESLADGVIDEMRERWDMVSAAEDRASGRQEPLRFVDKMLTNYYNVGFIHMLFPNALILHVAREPMDTVFSAYKHEFPPGPLDYTSDFQGLAEMYHGYRDLMEHWDRELPGRVTHVRYEDMVDDMPGVAQSIIRATGLEWDDGVLDFHKKKQAVNTLSTTQVRKGVYRDSLQAWRKYEDHLQPLVSMIGKRTEYHLKTSLLGYSKPPVEINNNADTAPEHHDEVEDDGHSDSSEEPTQGSEEL